MSCVLRPPVPLVTCDLELVSLPIPPCVLLRGCASTAPPGAGVSWVLVSQNFSSAVATLRPPLSLCILRPLTLSYMAGLGLSDRNSTAHRNHAHRLQNLR
jgi:hypothetical protein